VKLCDYSSHYSFSEIHNILASDNLRNKIKILTWNVHSIKSFNAFVNFKHDISGIVGNGIDFILLTETWLDCNMKFDLYKINNYNSIKCFRDNGRNIKSVGGGLIIYVRDSYNYKILRSVSLSHIEFLIIEIIIGRLKFILVCIYRPSQYIMSII